MYTIKRLAEIVAFSLKYVMQPIMIALITIMSYAVFAMLKNRKKEK